MTEMLRKLDSSKTPAGSLRRGLSFARDGRSLFRLALADMLLVAIGQQVVARVGIGAVGFAFDHRQYDLTELAKGDGTFAATGVTNGSLLKGVKRLKGGTMTTYRLLGNSLL